MYVTHLSLTDFRSYEQLDLPLRPGVTVLIGPNGQGKTNLVEAVGYVATLASHRVGSDAPLVRRGAARAVVRASVLRDGRATLVELEITPGRANRARVNRAAVPRAREVLGILRTVLFAPEDLALVKGDPAERRGFLDDLLVARVPRMAGVRADYERVLRQRSALLKSAVPARRRRGAGPGGADRRLSSPVAARDRAEPAHDTLAVWDVHLARTGSELWAARLDLVQRLAPLVATAYVAVAGDTAVAPSRPGDAEAAGHVSGAVVPSALERTDGTVHVSYRSALGPDAPTTTDRDELAQALLDGMAIRRRDELDRGVCLVGPHRDELHLALGALPARGYASHGECWSFALALRLASYALLRAEQGSDPVLVLDDVFAELDSGRRERLASLVADAEQVLVTAAVPEDVPAVLGGVRALVRDGQVLDG